MIGRGDVSVVHLAAIEKLGASLVAVVDSKIDHRVMLDELRPDIVHICTPHDRHVPIAIDALERGSHVLLEKPVAHTIEEAERLVAAAKDFPDLQVGVCLQNRYNTSSKIVKSRAAARGGSATVIWHRPAAYYEAKPWRGQRLRSGGGVLINQAIHTIDLMQWFLGDVADVSGHIMGYPGLDVEGTANLMLDHAGGARSVIFATVANVVDSPVTIEIVTDDATFSIRGDLTISYADGRTEVIAEPLPESGGRAYWGASHELLIADFYRAISHGEPFWITPSEALKSQYVIDELYRRNS